MNLGVISSKRTSVQMSKCPSRASASGRTFGHLDTYPFCVRKAEGHLGIWALGPLVPFHEMTPSLKLQSLRSVSGHFAKKEHVSKCPSACGGLPPHPAQHSASASAHGRAFFGRHLPVPSGKMTRHVSDCDLNAGVILPTGTAGQVSKCPKCPGWEHHPTLR